MLTFGSTNPDKDESESDRIPPDVEVDEWAVFNQTTPKKSGLIRKSFAIQPISPTEYAIGLAATEGMIDSFNPDVDILPVAQLYRDFMPVLDFEQDGWLNTVHGNINRSLYKLEKALNMFEDTRPVMERVKGWQVVNKIKQTAVYQAFKPVAMDAFKAFSGVPEYAFPFMMLQSTITSYEDDFEWYGALFNLIQPLVEGSVSQNQIGLEKQWVALVTSSKEDTAPASFSPEKKLALLYGKVFLDMFIRTANVRARLLPPPSL
jgi:hypothetical protein